MAEDTITILEGHYKDAKNVLDTQVPKFRGRVDLYRGHIDNAKWPYRSKVFDPRVSTIIDNKTARIFAQPPRGKVHPREGADVASAHVVNELINFHWDTANHYNGTMLEKWMLMDQWARIYGSSFGLVRWFKNKDFDGPEFQVLRNVDILPDPRATSMEDANWVQVVEYTTLGDLENTSDFNGKRVFQNLGALRKKIRDGYDQDRGANYRSRNLEIWGIDDTVNNDPAFQQIRIVTEYRRDKWFTFLPDFHLVIREIDNPYGHGQIPIVMLRYYPLGDTLYGLSEVERIEGLQKGVNAIVNQRLDSGNLLLNPIVHANPAEVRMHTLQWRPGAVWDMDRPNQSVQMMSNPDQALGTFTTTYSLMVASLNNAAGEQSVGTSNLGVFNPEKTATEIADIASIRNAKDVNNAHFLSEAIKRQTMMWIDMSKDFLEFPRIVRIVGKQAIERIRESGFSDQGASVYGLEPDVQSRFNEIVPGEIAEVKIFEDDLKGEFDYIPDVEAMALPNQAQLSELRRNALEFMLNPAVQQQMMAAGIQPDVVELLSDMLEDAGLKDARKYFEKSLPQPQLAGQVPGQEQGVAPQEQPPAEPEAPQMQGRGVLASLLNLVGRG